MEEQVYNLLKDRTEPVTIGWMVDRLFVNPKELHVIIKKDKRYIWLNKGVILRKNYNPKLNWTNL